MAKSSNSNSKPKNGRVQAKAKSSPEVVSKKSIQKKKVAKKAVVSSEKQTNLQRVNPNMAISIDVSRTPSEMQATLINAEKLHLQGKLQEAWVLYQTILRQDPAHYGAIHGMGLIAAQMKS
jgi:hypothetical protein